MVTWDIGNVSTAMYARIKGKYQFLQSKDGCKVIAWAELPEAYKHI